MAPGLMLILLLVVLLVPGLIMLAVGSRGYTARRAGEDGPDADRAKAVPGELPELLRRPLRARFDG
jgi:hypothetical protein